MSANTIVRPFDVFALEITVNHVLTVADSDTLFLDELAEIPMATCVKIITTAE